MLLYYQAMFIISAILTLIYIKEYHEHFTIHFTLIFALVPLANAGHMLIAQADTLEGAVLANTLTYVGGCFLQPLMTFLIFEQCHIHLKKWITLLISIGMTGIFACVLTTGKNEFFYKSVELAQYKDVTLLEKDYGPIHTVFYILIIAFLVLNLVLLNLNINKKDVSLKITTFLLIINIIDLLSYFLPKLFKSPVDYIPAAYNITLVLLLWILKDICLYDVNDTIIDNIIQNGTIGYVNFDLKRRFLGANEAAFKYFPELANVHIDRHIPADMSCQALIDEWIDSVDRFKKASEKRWENNEIIFKITSDYLYDGSKVRGYQIKIEDNTKQEHYINLINNYNDELEEAVAQKTARLMDMQDKLILSMADMVENRDPNTGGHIKRTSEAVKILVSEMRKDSELKLTDEFYDAVIKAAPMHDLGKITVDDAILRKPGKFTDEEFAIMKNHAAKGGEIVRHILDSIDDRYFAQIAENVAHYHHERVDGSGYPDHLKKDQIPFEARIMAIADVYDALVSKRCYKEKFDYEKAFNIIEDGMGSQFDESLNKYFTACRPLLEAYYDTQSDNSEN